MPWYVYIARCADGSLYTGISNDVVSRIARHNDGKGAAYTRSRLPVVLLWKKRIASRSAALKREALIKGLTKKEKELLVVKRNNAS